VMPDTARRSVPICVVQAGLRAREGGGVFLGRIAFPQLQARIVSSIAAVA